MTQVRPYRGVEAADRVAERRRRFLEAGRRRQRVAPAARICAIG